ncbi:MAG: RRXRR domain-containing protein [Spirulina sp.]
MERVSVLSPQGKPLMPTKASRARRWLKDGKAKVVYNDLGIFCVQLLQEPSGEETQPIAVGLDPGKHYSGIGVQSAKATLWTAHLILPFKTIVERMELRRVMRRARRGRRINRKLPCLGARSHGECDSPGSHRFEQRCHRQKRFNNRRQGKLPPSIRANRQLELRVVRELCRIYPISVIHYEKVMADVDRTSGRKGAKSGVGFSPVMVGQKKMLEWLSQLAPVNVLSDASSESCVDFVKTHLGWQRDGNGTSQLRKWLGLEKNKSDKSKAEPATHAVDGITLAAFEFIEWREWHTHNAKHGAWVGEVQITSAPFSIIRRPPISRRQLHLCVPAKGGKRRKYGGTVTRHGFRKGDLVKATKAGRVYVGWCSGDTAKAVSVSDINWKRLGQFTASKVELLQRSTGLICQQETKFAGAASVC